MIKNVVFDMGGVLIEFNPEKFARIAGFEDPQEIKEITDLVYRTGIWSDMDAGIYTAENGHNIIYNNLPEKYKEKAYRMIYEWHKMREPINGMPELVKSIKEKGYGVYLLSNAADDQPLYWEKTPYPELFNGVYVSCFHKKTKPHREVYEDFVSEFKLNKEECIFVDDSKANIEAAIEFGMMGYVFDGNADKFKDFLINEAKLDI